MILQKVIFHLAAHCLSKSALLIQPIRMMRRQENKGEITDYLFSRWIYQIFSAAHASDVLTIQPYTYATLWIKSGSVADTDISQFRSESVRNFLLRQKSRDWKKKKKKKPSPPSPVQDIPYVTCMSVQHSTSAETNSRADSWHFQPVGHNHQVNV